MRWWPPLRRDLPEASFEVPDGGYYVWVTLPDGADGDAIARSAIEGGVTVLPGSKFFASSDLPAPEEPPAHRVQPRDARRDRRWHPAARDGVPHRDGGKGGDRRMSDVAR
jgi:hypothetical protein